jgi:hypothetical protein
MLSTSAEPAGSGPALDASAQHGQAQLATCPLSAQSFARLERLWNGWELVFRANMLLSKHVRYDF